ncbi:MAG TPA: Uma2 family endonuclease [Verrucomicrobiae bacterium]|nr:Uma2 family endonuclease [Verrucomicrobiae bacterium]
MTEPYDELLYGEPHLRLAPGERHERLCARLHATLLASVANLGGTRLLPVRTRIQLNSQHALRPDLALVTTANNRLWLAVEIVSSDDHRVDTVLKKQIYEDTRLPRLWMVDPRYDNVEVYHATAYGLVLKGILAGSEILSEPLLPEFQIAVRDLFAAGATPPAN